MNTWKNTKWKYSQDNKWVHNKAHHAVNRPHQICALNTASRLNKAAQWMFTRKTACPPLTQSPLPWEPQVLVVMAREWVLNEWGSLNLNPSAWQKTAVLSAFFCLYLFIACPSSDITILLNHVCSLLFLFCLSQHCFSSRAHDDKNSFEFWRSLYIF